MDRKSAIIDDTKLYACGGEYTDVSGTRFTFVHGGGRVYVTDGINAMDLFKLCAHHSHLYEVGNNGHIGNEAILVSKGAFNVGSPRVVVLSSQQKSELQRGVVYLWQMMPSLRSASELTAIAKEIMASEKQAGVGASIITNTDMIDFVFSPFDGNLQIGMGGEWWIGRVKMGKNEFHHRKENVDPAYKPVRVDVSSYGEGLVFDVTGGFGYEAIIEIVAKAK